MAAVERRVRVLEDDLEASADRRASASDSAARARAVELDHARASGRRSRAAVRASVVLPLPDSPTSPSVSPGQIDALTPTRACTSEPTLVEDLAQIVEPEQRLADAVDRQGARARPPPRAAARGPRVVVEAAGACGRGERPRAPAPPDRQRSSASAQRSAKTQPVISAPRLGRNPGIVSSRPVILADASSRNAAQQADGVGMTRILQDDIDRPLLDEAARVEHADRVAHLRR